MVYFFKIPLPKAGQSVRFASSPVKSDRRLLGPTNLKSTVGQYSLTNHTNTVSTIAGTSNSEHSELPVGAYGTNTRFTRPSRYAGTCRRCSEYSTRIRSTIIIVC
jgi:hypothetical protein